MLGQSTPRGAKDNGGRESITSISNVAMGGRLRKEDGSLSAGEQLLNWEPSVTLGEGRCFVYIATQTKEISNDSQRSSSEGIKMSSV